MILGVLTGLYPNKWLRILNPMALQRSVCAYNMRPTTSKRRCCTGCFRTRKFPQPSESPNVRFQRPVQALNDRAAVNRPFSQAVDSLDAHSSCMGTCRNLLLYAGSTSDLSQPCKTVPQNVQSGAVWLHGNYIVLERLPGIMRIIERVQGFQHHKSCFRETLGHGFSCFGA